MRGSPIEVRLLFGPKDLGLGHGRGLAPEQQTTVDEKGCLTLRLQVADTTELVGWILSLGRASG